jgi:hypothetical protein
VRTPAQQQRIDDARAAEDARVEEDSRATAGNAP